MPEASTTSTRPPRWRVLIWPGGTEIGLELRQSLAWCKDITLFSASAPVSNHAPYVFRRHFSLPSVTDPAWVNSLNSLLAAERITHVFPAHDDTIVGLAQNADRLTARVITSPLETCLLTRSKRQTLEHLAGHVPVPHLFRSAEEVEMFPVFVKPDRGQGSFNAARAGSRPELEALLLEDPSRIILEYLPGPEFTVDCFSDRERGLLYASGRQRRRIRNGIAMDSVTVDDPRFAEYARRIAARIPLHGAWFYQVKATATGEWKLLEVAPRVGGTSALSRARGVNLPLLSLYEADRIPVQISPGGFAAEIDRALVNRFKLPVNFSTLYVDFDDTLTLHGRVNVELIKLLYQSLNRGVRLVLITRHAGDLPAALQHYRLTGLFDEVIHLRDRQPKADYIREKDAILIDDSFAERAAVQAATGIPVFDPGAVEALLDERL